MKLRLHGILTNVEKNRKKAVRSQIESYQNLTDWSEDWHRRPRFAGTKFLFVDHTDISSLEFAGSRRSTRGVKDPIATWRPEDQMHSFRDDVWPELKLRGSFNSESMRFVYDRNSRWSAVCLSFDSMVKGTRNLVDLH